MKKALIVYTTISGNTSNLSEIIKEILEKQYGYTVHIASTKDKKSIQGYDLVLLGSYTWHQGKLPSQMKRYLRNIFIEEKVEDSVEFSVYGTGESQYGGMELYCRAVDALDYYCEKYAKKPLSKLKVEQNPMYKSQFDDIYAFVIETMEGMGYINESRK